MKPQADMPFDGKRMFWGGFARSSTPSDRQARRQHASPISAYDNPQRSERRPEMSDVSTAEGRCGHRKTDRPNPPVTLSGTS